MYKIVSRHNLYGRKDVMDGYGNRMKFRDRDSAEHHKELMQRAAFQAGNYSEVFSVVPANKEG